MFRVNYEKLSLKICVTKRSCVCDGCRTNSLATTSATLTLFDCRRACGLKYMLLWTFLEGKEAASLITQKMCVLAIKSAQLQKTATSLSGKQNMLVVWLALGQVSGVSYPPS